MPSHISRSVYADMFGPTTGDRVRWKKTFAVYGEEVKFGGGKVIRDGMGQSQIPIQRSRWGRRRLDGLVPQRALQPRHHQYHHDGTGQECCNSIFGEPFGFRVTCIGFVVQRAPFGLTPRMFSGSSIGDLLGHANREQVYSRGWSLALNSPEAIRRAKAA
jgi:hypothetical protein